MSNTEHNTVRELEAQLAAARQAETQARQARMESVPIQWAYSVTPSRDDSWDRSYDDTCVFYTVSGKVVNREDAESAGHPSYSMHEGGMRYAYNLATHKIICAIGGGTVYSSDPDTMKALGEFIRSHPMGGDVTEIIAAGRKRGF